MDTTPTVPEAECTHPAVRRRYVTRTPELTHGQTTSRLTTYRCDRCGRVRTHRFGTVVTGPSAPQEEPLPQLAPEFRQPVAAVRNGYAPGCVSLEVGGRLVAVLTAAEARALQQELGLAATLAEDAAAGVR